LTQPGAWFNSPEVGEADKTAACRPELSEGIQVMTGSSAVSLWDETSEELYQASPMPADIKTDLAIVGGGYTGLSTALHAAEKGLDACVLEARQIGFGGSGRNVGLLNAGLWLPPQDVRARLGGERGGRLVDILGEGPAT
jgi:NADPH-dependent 2,4-dienoyl-CoA reductase/sulfur reductase-like enzyme